MPKQEVGNKKHRKVVAEPEQGTIVSPAAVREVVESIVIAFVLAFLFRTFEAEAFVIPTGSMAPTLMGRHKDLACPQCGYPFQVSASDEIDNETNRPTGREVIAGTCPNCRFTVDLGEGNPEGKTYRSYKGDRILVGKFPYQFGEPERWDVAVFKYPGGAKTNYIKRVVGLPKEWLQISDGDVYTQPLVDDAEAPSSDAWRIARKPPRKLRAMLRMVYDNRYALGWMIEKGWPARWQPSAAGALGDWVTSADYTSFETDGSADGEVWVHYRHVVPSYDDWQRLLRGPLPEGANPKPELITDFTPYNTEELNYYHQRGPDPHQLGLHWVGDLAIEAELNVGSETGEVILELVEGGRRFQCRIDVADGTALLSIDSSDAEGFRPTASTGIRGPGTYDVLFANADDQLTLWVNGRVVEFDAATMFGPLDNTLPTRADLEPVRIGSAGAKLRVEDLKVLRDIYYIAEKFDRAQYSPGPITDYEGSSPTRQLLSNGDDFRSDPVRFREELISRYRRSVQFKLQRDQFLMFGDNSAESKDSRLWGAEIKDATGENLPHYVSRELLIGKALFIYWPHSLDRVPYLNIPIRFFPNFKRMWLVR